MNAITLSLLASVCAALSSLLFRKSCTKNGSPSGYLILFYFCAFILSFLVYPEIWRSDFSPIFFSVGILVGILSTSMMLLTSQALKHGPAGLTYSFQNASAIFPGLILFLILGSSFGFSYTFLQFIGVLLVILGLFTGSKNNSSQELSNKWLIYALACFAVQICALTLIQARCVLFDCSKLGHFFAQFSFSEKEDIWFMPGQFGASCLMQLIYFLREKKRIEIRSACYGILGGVANFSSTLLLLLSTKWAMPFEKSILFPCFAVSTMILCNLWANRLYKEKFNFKANTLCSIGIFMAASG